MGGTNDMTREEWRELVRVFRNEERIMLKQSDLKISSLRMGKHYTIRVTHLPTGTTVERGGEGYLMQREQALSLLEEKLNADTPVRP